LAGAGSRPRQMALKWSKMGYIPFIASQKCLKGNLGGGRTRGSCPLLEVLQSALPSPSMLQRQQPPAVECNPSHGPTHGHTRPRFAPTSIDLPWSLPRTGPRGGYAAIVLATYDTPLSAAVAAVYLGSWFTAINAQLTRFAPRGSVLGVCSANLAMPHSSPLAETGRRHRVHEKYITGSRVGDADRVAHWVHPGDEALR
jgi:hypothetical protein